MLRDTRVVTTLPVVNVERAQRFYAQALGLRERERLASGALIFEAGAGARIELVPRAEPTRAEHTALSFEVDDLEREVGDLEARGVRFEDYDMPGLRTQGHIADLDGERAAWFKDPEGNILCVHERVHERA
jgi:catechol 2,3-dioxygenase-like lactoylglutathione lyase family enzyme